MFSSHIVSNSAQYESTGIDGNCFLNAIPHKCVFYNLFGSVVGLEGTVVDVTAVAEGVVVGNIPLKGGGIGAFGLGEVAPGVVGVGVDEFSGRVVNTDDVTLQILLKIVGLVAPVASSSPLRLQGGIFTYFFTYGS